MTDTKKVYRYFLVHKPVGVICSTIDPQPSNIIVKKDDPRCGERRHGKCRLTIYDIAQTNGFPTDIGLVGRLDMDTSGIMLMTDDAILNSAIRTPVEENEKEKEEEEEEKTINLFKYKEYEMKLIGKRLLQNIDVTSLERELSSPFTFQRQGRGYQTSPANVRIERIWRDEQLSYGQPHLGWCISVRIKIREGKHHQLRRMAKRSNLHVLSLHRSCIAHILHSSSVPSGECRWLSNDEINTLHAELVNKE
mmetsp:Transcript_38623/g.39318  ORF Transcript_38623/g.39318 Transcript_38623/m.39318 type:complete len:250 (+) Transcript_38623:381-1130(+)